MAAGFRMGWDVWVPQRKIKLCGPWVGTQGWLGFAKGEWLHRRDTSQWEFPGPGRFAERDPRGGRLVTPVKQGAAGEE